MEKEIIFLVEEAPEGGYTARALGHNIFTEADSFAELKKWCRMPCSAILRPKRCPGSSAYTW